MTRRFPPPIPGIPSDEERYRIVLEALRAVDPAPTKTEFVVDCKAALESMEEQEDELKKSWVRHILNDLIRSGFITETRLDGERLLEVGIDGKRWLDEEIDFEEFVWNSLKRGWVLNAGYPEGIEALERILHAMVYEADLPTTSREIRRILETEYDYGFSQQGIRGYLPLLHQIGVIAETDEGIAFAEGVNPEQRLQKFRRADIFRLLENWLRREGAMAEPPSNRAKQALMKYYMYRESGGWSKRRMWYREFYRDYLDEGARAATHKEPSLRRKDGYNERSNRKDRLRRRITDKFGITSKELTNLSMKELQRIHDAPSEKEARRIRVESGSGISRADLMNLGQSDRQYKFPDGFDLYDWQTEAADKWFKKGEDKKPMSGIAEVVTGAGKTVMALEVIRRWLNENDEGVVTVVVPTRVLMYQWLSELVSKLNVPVDQIGWAGDGHRNEFGDVRILVSIVNTAVKDDYLASQLENIGKPPHLLVADECHNYTGNVYSRILRYHKTSSLGLSATPKNVPTSERNEELTRDDDPLVRNLGPVYYTLTYGEAIRRQLIPRFKVHYVGFDLSQRERREYDALSRKISDVLKDIRARYGNRLHQLQGNFQQKLNTIRNTDDNPHPAIGKFFTLTQDRRDLVQDAVARQAITLRLLEDIDDDQKAIVFQERIEQLEQLIAPREKLGITREGRVTDKARGLRSEKYEEYPELKKVDQEVENLFARTDFWPVMYHSGHRKDIWNQFAMEWFRSNEHANVMFSVKALIEGVDVPDADLGIIRVSSGSVRQRIQTLGRILRTGDDPDAFSQLYVLYAKNTVDENIFRDYNWGEMLGSAEVTHEYWVTEDSPLNGDIKPAGEEPPTGDTYEKPDYPDIQELNPGDEYTGPSYGYKLSVDSKGKPFEKSRDGRNFIKNAEIRNAADLVHQQKGGGSIIINEEGHMLTKLPEKVIFLGVTEGPDSFEYEEKQRRSLTDEPPSFEDIFDS